MNSRESVNGAFFQNRVVCGQAFPFRSLSAPPPAPIFAQPKGEKYFEGAGLTETLAVGAIGFHNR